MEIELVFWTDGDSCAVYRSKELSSASGEADGRLEKILSGRSFGDVISAIEEAVKEAQQPIPR